MAPRLFYFNAGFDRKLQGEVVSPKLQRAIDAMALLLIPALSANDQICSKLTVPEEYYTYLAEQGLSGAQVTQSLSGIEQGEAWGWDSEAHDFFTQKSVPFKSPSLNIVKEINSRDFASTLAQKYGIGIPHTEIITSFDAYRTFVKRHPNYVIKPLFGNAGSGFIYSFGPIDCHEAARQLLHSDTQFIMEPWLDKTLDIATLIEITQTGEITIKGHHRNVSNRAGAFYANIILRDDPQIAPFREELNSKAHLVAQEVFKRGYWGTLGLDSILFTSAPGEEKLAFGFDINGRHPISTISYAIKEKMGNPPAFMYRFIAQRRLQKFGTLSEFVQSLKHVQHEYSNDSHIVLTTPFTYVDETHFVRSPARFSFAIAAEDEQSLENIDLSLRKKLLR